MKIFPTSNYEFVFKYSPESETISSLIFSTNPTFLNLLPPETPYPSQLNLTLSFNDLSFPFVIHIITPQISLINKPAYF
jgi:hypothetical protein